MVQIIHAADLHLGNKQYKMEEREEDILKAFDQVLEHVLREKPDLFIIAGDFFDTPKPPNKIIKYAQDAIKKIVDHGVKVYSVIGDHDYPKRRDLSPIRLVPGVKLLYSKELNDIVTIDGKEVFIQGFPYMPPAYRQKNLLVEYLVKPPSSAWRSIFVAHIPIEGFMPFEQGIALLDIPSGYNYAALGHIHRRIKYERDDGLLIAYPGSLEILRENEIEFWMKEGKGVYLVDLSGDLPSIEELDVEVRPQYIINVSYNNFAHVIENLLSRSKSSRKPLLHVHIKLPSSYHKPGIAKKIQSMFANRALLRLIYEYEDEGKTRREQGRALTLVDAIKQLVGKEEIARTIYELMQALNQEKEKEYIDKVIETILADKHVWNKLVPSTTKISTHSSLQRGGKSLLDYIGMP